MNNNKLCQAITLAFALFLSVYTGSTVAHAASPSNDITVTPEMTKYLQTVSKMAQDKWQTLCTKQTRQAIDKSWTKTPAPDQTEITVMAAFDAKGQPTAAKVSKSSGNQTLDGTAVAAVKAAAPYPQPPKAAVGLYVQMNFTYHAPPPAAPKGLMIPVH